MYKGLRTQLCDLIRVSMDKYDIQELALVGHSMGGALAYFLSLDLLDVSRFEPKTLPKIVLAAFGAPRCGNLPCMEYWRELVR
jgi:surfactin synthase thioesterase subunit